MTNSMLTINRKVSIEQIKNDEYIQGAMTEAFETLPVLNENEPLYKLKLDNDICVFSTSKLMEFANGKIAINKIGIIYNAATLLFILGLFIALKLNSPTTISIGSGFVMFLGIITISVVSTTSIISLVLNIYNYRIFKKISKFTIKHSENYLNYKKSEEKKESESKMRFIL